MRVFIDLRDLRQPSWQASPHVGGKIQHFWPQDKPIWLSAHTKSLGINLADVAAIGDSLGDVPMLAAVGHLFLSAPNCLATSNTRFTCRVPICARLRA